jgi:transcriptional regulator with GAF, ATPase, and Fis domain
MAMLPLLAGGQAAGAISFASFREARTWPPALLDRLRLIARMVASALVRARADQELRLVLSENEQLRQRLEAENAYLQSEVKVSHDFEDIVGRSAALRAVLHKLDQVAATDVPVLLLGDTGTGKELLAHAIHARSRRRARPLITVNCAALPPTLVESELFGHEKGAFTGAIQARPGRFDLADGSTLFLDEIGDLDSALQAKLLRALQNGEIHRVGAPRPHKVDARVIAATNRDLDALMREGRFRSDLYYRLGVFPIQVPRLRERREDIPLLVWHFIQSRQRALGRHVTRIAPDDMAALVAYDWPGNIRELQNVIDRALILSTGPVLHLQEAFGPVHPPAPGAAPSSQAATVPGPVTRLSDAERAHIFEILERCHWIIEGPGQAADRLGLRPSTLRNRMKKLGLRRPPGGR